METKEKTVSFFRFEDLRIYNKAVDYAQWVINTLQHTDSDAQKKLCETFIEASFNIGLNIAEGAYRNKSQFENYLKTAKTSVRECIVFTSIAYKTNTITDKEYETSRELLMELTRMVGALIVSLQRNSHKGNHRKETNTISEDDEIMQMNDDFTTDF